MKVRWLVLSAMLSLAGLGQVAHAKKDGIKQFTGAAVENDSVSVAVTKIALNGKGEMSVTLLVENKSARNLDVDLKGFVITAGAHKYQRDAKMLTLSTQTIKKGKPQTIKFDFKDIDPTITEATLKLSSAFRLTIPDMALTVKGGAGGTSQAANMASPSGDQPPSSDGSSGQ